MERKEYTTKDWIVSIVFLVWFFASIAGLLLTAKAGLVGWTLAIFGHYFIVIGIIAVAGEIKNGFHQPIVCVFPLVGFAVFACALVFQYGNDMQREQLVAQIPNVACGVFFIVGVLLFSNLYAEKQRQKKCTHMLQGLCVDVKERVSNSSGRRATVVRCPVFEYVYNGKTYTRDNGFYTNMTAVQIGQYKDVYINPENPKQFYEPDSAKASGYTMAIIGVLFVIVSTIAAYAYNFM